MPPTLSAISPSQGPTTGGTTVTLTGTGLTGSTSVRFDKAPASFTVNSATQITAVTPADSAGAVPVTVISPSGTSNAVTFTYVAAAVPVVTAVAPNNGPASGGTSVTITGTGFTGATAVRFADLAGDVVHRQLGHPDHRCDTERKPRRRHGHSDHARGHQRRFRRLLLLLRRVSRTDRCQPGAGPDVRGNGGNADRVRSAQRERGPLRGHERHLLHRGVIDTDHGHRATGYGKHPDHGDHPGRHEQPAALRLRPRSHTHRPRARQRTDFHAARSSLSPARIWPPRRRSPSAPRSPPSRSSPTHRSRPRHLPGPPVRCR